MGAPDEVGGTALSIIIIVIVIVSSAMASSSQAAMVIRVGGDDGWVVGVLNYTIWASHQPLHVGDYLEFNYVEDFHNVLEVTEASYASCNISNPIEEYKDGKTIVRLRKAKTYYFICGVVRHCSLGQKLKVLALGNTYSPSEGPIPIQSPILSPSLPPTPLQVSSCSQSMLYTLSQYCTYILLLMLVYH